MARELLESPDYLKSRRARIVSGEAGPLEQMLHYYAYGKPKEQTEHSGELTVKVVYVERNPDSATEAAPGPEKSSR